MLRFVGVAAPKKPSCLDTYGRCCESAGAPEAKGVRPAVGTFSRSQQAMKSQMQRIEVSEKIKTTIIYHEKTTQKDILRKYH